MSSPKRTPQTHKALLLTHIRQLLTMSGEAAPRREPALGELNLLEDAAVLCSGGKIVAVGSTDDAIHDEWLKSHRGQVHEFDCTSKVVLPGFVDSHTHPAFTHPRLVDFEKRIAGATYEEIAESGGGIRSSVAGVRETSRAELAENVRKAFEQMAAQGTTTVEAKSGYGLSVEAELKSLEAIDDAARQWPGTVVSTLLGAHVVPADFAGDRQEYVRLICEEMIPRAAQRDLAHFVDVYCDQGAFTLEETERIFTAAWEHGFGLRAHVGQFATATLNSLIKFDVASFDHMDHIHDEDIPLLAQSRTVATLLPGTNHFLGLSQYPPARKLIEGGVAVALATDFNPGSSPTPSMPFVLSLACTQMKMSPAEAITAATINAACALRLEERKGSIEPGKDADLAIFDVDDYREIPYWFGINHCSKVVVGGQLL